MICALGSMNIKFWKIIVEISCFDKNLKDTDNQFVHVINLTKISSIQKDRYVFPQTMLQSINSSKYHFN